MLTHDAPASRTVCLAKDDDSARDERGRSLAVVRSQAGAWEREKKATMLNRLRQMRLLIKERYPESNLTLLTTEQLSRLRKRFPDLPEHLANFFKEVGCGRIGDCNYMIYALLGPNEVFDPKTAAGLDGVVLVGDDFAGCSEAYHTKRNWQFGSVGSNGKFEPHTKYPTLIDFIEGWYVKTR
jgi:hypothetical protein